MEQSWIPRHGLKDAGSGQDDKEGDEESKEIDLEDFWQTHLSTMTISFLPCTWKA